MTLKTRRTLLIASIILFAILVVPLLMYTIGYRLTSDLRLVKTGGLYILTPETDSDIYINNEKFKKGINFLQNGFFIQNLTPGTYSIMIAKEGMWPWAKTVKVEPKMVSEIHAFMVPKDPEWKIIANEREFVSIRISLDKKIIILSEKVKTGAYKLAFFDPETSSFLKDGLKPDNVGQEKEQKIVTNKEEKIWIDSENNEVWAEWLGKDEALPFYFQDKKIRILKSQFPIRNIEFFPSRKDVVLLSTVNGIFALEFDNRENSRLMQPVYKGKSPDFIVFNKDNKIYAIDEGTFFSIQL